MWSELSSESDYSEEDLPILVKLNETWLGKSPPEAGRRTEVHELSMFSLCRRLYARNRVRYEAEGFDLDLSYITTKLIGMSLPGRGLKALWRNHIEDVQVFLEQKHSGAYRIYNLCAEESHLDNGFHIEKVASYPSPDHCPVSLDQKLRFCEDVKSWLSLCDDNVAVVHCKAGKGRTGVMIAALLIYSGAVATSEEALAWFALCRGDGTEDGGVTIPSQKRGLAAFEMYLKQNGTFLSHPLADPPHPYQLLSVRFGPIGQPAQMCACSCGTQEAHVKMELTTRDSILSAEDDHFVFDLTLPLDEDRCVEVDLPETDKFGKKPVWRSQDGRIKLKFTCDSETHTFSAWWTHATLQRQGPLLHMEMSSKDLDKHSLPANFKLMGKFQEVGTGWEIEQPLIDARWDSQLIR